MIRFQLFLPGLHRGGGTVAPETREAITAMLGQDGGNIFQQYIGYLKNIFTGNWGVSVTYFPNQVTTSIASALPWTICLVGTTTIISFFVQQALGIWAGWRRGGAFDNIISPVSTIFQAVPYFWLALIFIWVFARTLHWFPQSGGYNYREVVPGFTWEFFSSAVQYAILPALTILVSSLGMGVVGMRNMMVSTLSEDYIVTAEAKGLSPKRVRCATQLVMQCCHPFLALARLSVQWWVDRCLLNRCSPIQVLVRCFCKQ